MKFCPHCGNEVSVSGAGFCQECGKSLNAASTGQQPRPSVKPPAQKGSPAKSRRPPPKTAFRPTTRATNSSSRLKQNKRGRGVQERTRRPNPMDENYDGYYNDVPTDDNGESKDRTDPALIKRAALVAVGALAVIILAVIIMTLL